jgi:two-component system phosphate regulon sensor histidine kinase PhoR
MDSVVKRTVVGAAAAAAGAALGAEVGALWVAPLVGACAGAALGSAAYGLWDNLAAHRLMRWLGEVAYRVERTSLLMGQKVNREREQRVQFLQAIEASPNGVLMLDRSDQIEWCNSVAADHFGLHPQRDLLQPITNLVRSPAFVAHLQSGAHDAAIEFAAPGDRGTLSVLVRAYGDGMKLVLSQDITERERNEAMRRDFVANVSHEIRTPLTVLAGFVETMISLPLSEAERARVLQLMTQQTQRMQTLVADLLTLAQLEGSPRPASDHWVPLAPMFQRIRADAQALSVGRHVLHVDDPRGLQLAGAEAELLSAVSNLVTNAVRYTPEGGAVSLLVGMRADGHAEVEVRDSGIGIAREHLPRLTERFYRVDGSRSRDTGGTGLGLSIVKHVAQRHGGELDVKSEPGQGSSFKLIFPASRVRTGEHASDARLPHAAFMVD